MKKSSFLNKLRKDGKIELVEPSEEIKDSYLEKADNCLKAAKILLQSELYENSIIDSYYVMYNSLLALLYKVGIKSENHSATIVLLNTLIDAKDLFRLISFAKEERIDKQYYVETKGGLELTKETCEDMVAKAENYLVKIKLLVGRINNDDVASIRAKFLRLFKET